MNSKLLKHSIILIIVFLISGCASTQSKHAPEFLSASFSKQVQQELLIIPVIDARNTKDKDLQDIIGYKTMRSNSVISSLESKGYLVKELDIDVRSCQSVSNIKVIQDFNCLPKIDATKAGMILLISVDEYTAPEAMSVSGLAYVSGVLYDTKSNSILWKDSLKKGADDEAMLLVLGGGGGYLGALLVKAVSPNLIYRNDAFSSIRMVLESMPKYAANQ